MIKSDQIFSENHKHINQIHLLFYALYLIIYTTSCWSQTGDITYVHDPCMIKAGDYYYIFSTGDRIAIRRSPDMVNWQYIGEVFDEIPEWGREEVSGVSNIWAPDIFYKDGMYYLYYSLSTFGSNQSRIGLVTNTTLNPYDKDYQWADQGKVVESNTDNNYNAIDPNIFEVNDSTIWMSFGSFWTGIKLIQMDPRTMKPFTSGSLTAIASRPYPGAIEAPFIFKRNGFYYLFVSFDICCQGVNSTYKIMVGRAEKITGTYYAKNGSSMLSGGGTLVRQSSTRWKGPGHCAIFSENGTDWLVHHAYDANNNGITTLQIRRLEWDSEGWPVTIIDTLVSMKSPQPRTTDFKLYQNFPNPFNPATIIPFEIIKTGHVTLKVFNLAGQEIAVLVDDKLSSGRYQIPFEAKELQSGLYFYGLDIAGGLKDIKKMLFIK
jgi:arabinan endo-1,5-alpha-L-arabinosidase